MKKYYITIEVKETHEIEVKDDVEINENTVFEYISQDSLIKSEWIYAKDIERVEE